MDIAIGPELEAAIKREAEQRGMDPRGLALQVLWHRFLGPVELSEPRDEWERRLREIGRPIGANLSDEAISRDGLYD